MLTKQGRVVAQALEQQGARGRVRWPWPPSLFEGLTTDKSRRRTTWSRRCGPCLRSRWCGAGASRSRTRSGPRPPSESPAATPVRRSSRPPAPWSCRSRVTRRPRRHRGLHGRTPGARDHTARAGQTPHRAGGDSATPEPGLSEQPGPVAVGLHGHADTHRPARHAPRRPGSSIWRPTTSTCRSTARDIDT